MDQMWILLNSMNEMENLSRKKSRAKLLTKTRSLIPYRFKDRWIFKISLFVSCWIYYLRLVNLGEVDRLDVIACILNIISLLLTSSILVGNVLCVMGLMMFKHILDTVISINRVHNIQFNSMAWIQWAAKQWLLSSLEFIFHRLSEDEIFAGKMPLIYAKFHPSFK